MGKWISLEKESPSPQLLVAIWRSGVRKFVIGWLQAGPVRPASVVQKASLESRHWKTSKSRNRLRVNDKDWWYGISNLEITEVFGADNCPNNATLHH